MLIAAFYQREIHSSTISLVFKNGHKSTKKPIVRLFIILESVYDRFQLRRRNIVYNALICTLFKRDLLLIILLKDICNIPFNAAFTKPCLLYTSYIDFHV